MTSWFDIFHYTLVGFGVCFLLLLIMMAFQGIAKLIVMAHGNKHKQQADTVHTHTSEEHHVVHTRNVHHYEYDEEVVARPKTVRTTKVPPIEYQRLEQTFEKPQMITRARRP